MKKRGIKWVFICGVDNILLKFLDPLFLGISIHKNSQVSSKTMFKEDPLSPEYVFGRLNGKPTILDYKLVSESLTHEVDDEGNFLYRELNVLSHLFTIEAIEKASTLNLPYHRAYKKNTFINDEGMKQVPENKNSFKFETFIFDAFNYFDDLLLFRVSKDEFAPIKDAVRCE